MKKYTKNVDFKEVIPIAKILIAGTHSGCGKTTVTAGIMAALVRRGLVVQPFKVGPDYIDPLFHTYITGRESRNLDSWLLDETTLRGLFLKNAATAGIAVIEGVMGVFDGFGGESLAGSTAHMARLIKAPVILVVDGKGMALSIAALIKGYRDFDPELHIAGVILNHIATDAHYQYLREIIEPHLGIPVLGYLPARSEYALASRHLGLIPRDEVADIDAKIASLVKQVEATIDLDGLLQLANQAESLSAPDFNPEFVPEHPGLRLAIAKDPAFNFYYADNLDLLKMLGMELVFFSPLNDKAVPGGVGGLYLGGGFPEVWAAGLEANRGMRESIRRKIASGLPVYAECGGLMYLTESLRDMEGNEFQMAGALPGRSRMTTALQRFGYVEVQVVEDNVISPQGDRIRGHEFHYSTTEVDPGVPRCFRVVKTKGGKETAAWDCGFKVGQLLAGYVHLHFWSNPAFARTFVKKCAEYSGERFG
jgi:cobyrinic acid a,c-diamide synthase